MSRRKQSDEPPEQPGLITSEKLSAITGYTDVWHRAAAKAGYFPPPANGLYKTVPTLQGLFKRERDLRAKSTGGLANKKESKLDKEIALLDLELAERNKSLVSIEEMDQRMRPFLVALRQKILGSTMTDDEKDELITDAGKLLEHALTRNITPSTAEPAEEVEADSDEASASDSQQVGG